MLELEIKKLEAKGRHDDNALLQLRAELDVANMEHDALLEVQGQRKTGETPIKELFFDAGLNGSWQFRDDRQTAPTVYLE
jgi:hypothetical protein